MAQKNTQTVIWKRATFVFVAVAAGLLIFAIGVVILTIGAKGQNSNNGENLNVDKSNQDGTSFDESLTATLEWSAWSETLPSTVTSDNYVIETKTLYSSRERQTMQSPEEKAPEGWELYDVQDGPAEYGSWSDWQQAAPPAFETHEVEQQTRYRYRELEHAESATSAMPGWKLEDTTYSWGQCGSWSEWTETPILADETCEVETTTQWRFRDLETITSMEPSLDGWQLYDMSYNWGEYGDWSNWSTASMNGSDSRQVQSKTQYRYGIYVSDLSYEDGSTFFDVYPYSPNRSHAHYETWWLDNPLPVVWDSRYNCYSYGPYGSYEDFEYWYNEESRVLYRYRDRSQIVTYYYERWGNWSSWNTASVHESDTRQVESKVLYRSRERQQVPTYHFTRWGEWSPWSTADPGASDAIQVETDEFYRFRSCQTKKIYCYQCWTEWSEYVEQPVSQTTSVQVRQKVVYRYRPK